MKRQLAERSGRDAEARAASWLSGQGWSILAERVKMKGGEVDLIARKEAVVAFVEVKWRYRPEELDFAIDERRLARVAAAAEALAADYASGGEDIRIDVILLAPGTPPRHIANAWQP